MEVLFIRVSLSLHCATLFTVLHHICVPTNVLPNTLNTHRINANHWNGQHCLLIRTTHIHRIPYIAQVSFDRTCAGPTNHFDRIESGQRSFNMHSMFTELSGCSSSFTLSGNFRGEGGANMNRSRSWQDSMWMFHLPGFTRTNGQRNNYNGRTTLTFHQLISWKVCGTMNQRNRLAVL